MMNASDKLAELNALSGPDAIAQLFRNTGVYGNPVDATSCPVARYVARDLPDVEFVGVSSTYAAINYLTNPMEVIKYDWKSPVGQFIINFDNGRYPELRIK